VPLVAPHSSGFPRAAGEGQHVGEAIDVPANRITAMITAGMALGGYRGEVGHFFEHDSRILDDQSGHFHDKFGMR